MRLAKLLTLVTPGVAKVMRYREDCGIARETFDGFTEIAESMNEHDAQLIVHCLNTYKPLLDALKSIRTENCANCGHLAGEGRGCLIGNNTEARHCCYHTIRVAIAAAEEVKS